MQQLKNTLEALSINTASLCQVKLPAQAAQHSPFYMLDISADDAEACWRKASAKTDLTGYYPIITDSVDEVFEYMEFPQFDANKKIKEVETIDVADFLKKKAAGLVIDSEVQGKWPTEEPPPVDELYIVTRALDSEIPLKLLFCPTRNSWEICPLIGWGNSNDGVDPACHGALHQYWHTKYGAQLVCLTVDIMEFIVKTPPTIRELVLELAREQYIYCPDIVDQGVETISNLAKTLVGNKQWYFWWD